MKSILQGLIRLNKTKFHVMREENWCSKYASIVGQTHYGMDTSYLLIKPQY